jgi:hypothetical protein
MPCSWRYIETETKGPGGQEMATLGKKAKNHHHHTSNGWVEPLEAPLTERGPWCLRWSEARTSPSLVSTCFLPDYHITSREVPVWVTPLPPFWAYGFMTRSEASKAERGDEYWQPCSRPFWGWRKPDVTVNCDKPKARWCTRAQQDAWQAPETRAKQLAWWNGSILRGQRVVQTPWRNLKEPHEQGYEP